MLRPLRPKVLILADQPDVARRWADALAESVASVWFSETELAGEQVDVIVTDLTRDAVAGRTQASVDPAAPDGGSGIEGMATVGIGPASWADVALPADCTEREVRLACELLAQIAHLRNQRDELDRSHREVKQLAQTDPLTGLPNRRAWDQQLQMRLAFGARGRGQLWLAIVDLDHFKQVNDRLGMSQGDAVLARAAGALAGELRGQDVVARLGGDEFGILLWNVAEQHVEGVFDRLRAAVADQATPDQTDRVTASMGYISVGDGSAGVASLFAAAERAMREAKRAGGDQACRADSRAAEG